MQQIENVTAGKEKSDQYHERGDKLPDHDDPLPFLIDLFQSRKEKRNIPQRVHHQKQ
jgi:hypothetical protein